jgi:radical SAM superfamily enzyme YgiQ (UPF0313 family)
VSDSSFVYPVKIPPLEIPSGLDLLILDMPGRYMPFVPNNLGALDLILRETGAKYHLLDVNIIYFHRYHSLRLAGSPDCPAEKGSAPDPALWEPVSASKWKDPELLKIFSPWTEELIQKITAAKPAAVGFSVSETSREISKYVTGRLRQSLPGVIILAGGYDCYFRNDGPLLFPDFDYMFIGETELTLGPFTRRILAGEKCADTPGVVSRFDTPGRVWEPAPLPEDLDARGFPRYEWTGINVYRGFDGSFVMPLSGSRGCRWSRCSFCGERLKWRQRAPGKIFGELSYFYARGVRAFRFTESDFNGDPGALLELCGMIINAGLEPDLFGQIRVDKRGTYEFFKTLRRAGFKFLRFGVDGWCDETLRLERKGYNMALAEQNLRDCKKAGISVSANIVIGIPGETEEMIDKSIENLISCADYIDRLDGVNTLIMFTSCDYCVDPERHGIKFHGDKEELLARYPMVVPVEFWHSENPYIDQSVRDKRLARLCAALYREGLPIGDFSMRIIMERTGESCPPPPLTLRDFGISVISHEDRFYALASGDGIFDPGKTGSYISADSASALKACLFRLMAGACGEERFDAACAGKPVVCSPDLIKLFPPRKIKTVPPYNIVKLLSTYYCAPFGVPVDWASGSPDCVPGMLRAASLEEAESLIAARAAAFGQSSAPPAPPRLIKTVPPYNIVLYGGFYYCAPFGVKIDWEKDDLAAVPGLLRAPDQRTAEELAARAAAPASPPRLVKTIAPHNIVEFRAKFYRAPFGVKIDWERDDLASIPGLLVFDDVRAAESSCLSGKE